MTRSFSTVHGRSRTTKPRPARQSGSLSGRPQTSRRRLAMTRQAVGEISMPIVWAEGRQLRNRVNKVTRLNFLLSKSRYEIKIPVKMRQIFSFNQCVQCSSQISTHLRTDAFFNLLETYSSLTTII